MKRLFALLPIAGLAAGSILAAALMSSTAVAQACKLDNGGGCEREGMKCSPPIGGKCVTERVGTRELICTCKTSARPRPDRSERPSRPDRPSDEPMEEQEPQEEQPQ